MRSLCLILVLVTMSGCAAWGKADPIQRYAASQDLYLAALQTLIDARQAEIITASTWKRDILPLINEGDRLLDKIGEAAKAGQGATTDVYIDSLKSVIRQMLDARAKAGGTTERNTDEPADDCDDRNLRFERGRSNHALATEHEPAGRSGAPGRTRAAA